MTITSDQLKQAFAPITKISTKPAESTTVDLEKVATTLVAETNEFVTGDDPLSQLDSLVDRVDKIDALLEGATEDAEGNIVVPASALAKEFAVEKVDDSDDSDDDSDEDDDTDTSKNDDADDLSDDIDWDRDLSPPEMPASRSANLTKGEIPVVARKGARTRKQKQREARERALDRRALGRDGGRSLS